MISRRIAQAVVALGLALMVVFGAAGVASAKFLTPATSASLSVTTLKLEPPTALSSSCPGLFTRYPVVTFTRSSSIDVIASRPAGSRTYPLGYTVSITLNGAAYPDAKLSSTDTQWAGPTRNWYDPSRSWEVTIKTTYGAWFSAPSPTLKFSC